MAGPSPHKKDVKKLIRAAKRAVRRVPVCLRADLVDEYETLEAQLNKAKAAAEDSLGGDPRVAELTARLEELRAEMGEATVEFVIRALPEKQFTKVLTEHPPREGDKRDAVMGWNIDDVVEQLIRRGTEEPNLDDEDWQILLEETLNRATYAQLTNAAWSVNDKDVSVPF